MNKLLKLDRVVVAAAFLGLLAMALTQTIDTDCWWHLRTGQWIVENQQIPLVDNFSYTMGGIPWQFPTTDWLGDLSLYLVYAAAGLGGLNVFVALLALVGFFFVWKTMKGDVYFKAVVMLLAAMVAGVHWVARPLMFSFVLSAVFLWLLLRFDRGEGDALWWLPLLMMAWVNLHGGFLNGYIIWGVFMASSLIRDVLSFMHNKDWDWQKLLSAKTRRLLIVGLVMMAATCLNPSGPAIFGYPLMTVNMQASKDLINEWQSPDFHMLAMQPLIWLGLLVFIAAGVSKKRISLVEFFFMAGFGYLSLVSARNFPYFALTAPMVILNHVGGVISKLRTQNKPAQESASPGFEKVKLIFNAMLIVLMVFMVFIRLADAVLPRQIEKQMDINYPVEAVEYLQEAELLPNLFSTYNWGGYLTWHFPQYPVFIDGRADLYGDELIETWISTVNAEEGWQNTFSQYDIESVLIDPHWALNQALVDDGWNLVYQDEKANIYANDH